jgi:serine/threonine-protein kinase RsbW
VDTLKGSVRLAMPADPGSISIVRAIVASVASKLDLSYDSVDDLRIAAAEASALLLTSDTSSTRLHADLEPVEGGLRLALWVEGGEVTGLDERTGIAWRLIEGLTDEADVIEIDGHRGIELRVRAVHR